MCSVGPKGKHGVRNMARAHLCLHGPLLLHTRPESNLEAHVDDGHRDQRECCRSLPQATPALQPARYVLRAGRRPQPSMPHHRLPAGSHLVESTAAAAAAPSNATKTAARRPSSRLPDRPKRPEQAPAGDRSHRRIDAATSRVRASREHGLAAPRQKYDLPP